MSTLRNVAKLRKTNYSHNSEKHGNDKCSLTSKEIVIINSRKYKGIIEGIE